MFPLSAHQHIPPKHLPGSQKVHLPPQYSTVHLKINARTAAWQPISRRQNRPLQRYNALIGGLNNKERGEYSIIPTLQVNTRPHTIAEKATGEFSTVNRAVDCSSEIFTKMLVAHETESYWQEKLTEINHSRGTKDCPEKPRLVSDCPWHPRSLRGRATNQFVYFPLTNILHLDGPPANPHEQLSLEAAIFDNHFHALLLVVPVL